MSVLTSRGPFSGQQRASAAQGTSCTVTSIQCIIIPVVSDANLRGLRDKWLAKLYSQDSGSSRTQNQVCLTPEKMNQRPGHVGACPQLHLFPVDWRAGGVEPALPQ